MSAFKKLEVEEVKEDNLSKLLQKAKGLDFNAFWDLLGRPEKHNRKLGVLSYEKDLTNTLEQTKHLCVLKPVGSGITEFCLRWILWKIMSTDEWQNSQVCIVVGPSVHLANRILGRIRRSLEVHDITFDYAKNYLIINDCELFSVPSHNLNALRSLENPSCIYISEADYLPELSDSRECSERYISKSNPYIIMESTIRSATGLYSEIFKEENCLYTRKTVSYIDALNEGMYTKEQIEKAKSSRSFAKELLCDIYALGNVVGTFEPQWIQRAVNMNVEINPIEYSIGVDSGWSPALSGVTLLGKDTKGMHSVVTSDEYNHKEDEMVDLIITLKDQFNCKNIFVDSSDKRLIAKIKSYTKDQVEYEAHLAFLKHHKILNQWNPLKSLMTVVPVLFSQRTNREMLSYVRVCLENGTVQIPSNCETLQKALYNARDVDSDLIKEDLRHGRGGDCYDSFQIVLYSMDN